MTGPQHVTVRRTCPVCGADTTWVGRRTAHDGTDYDTPCDRCDWTWRAQVARRTTARTTAVGE